MVRRFINGLSLSSSEVRRLRLIVEDGLGPSMLAMLKADMVKGMLCFLVFIQLLNVVDDLIVSVATEKEKCCL